ncbi:MAG: hypothetical protein HYT12_02790 [Candidatus Liptonbacteria bacterium]|nr:hypothetical protein [Candidatus Liptonbacteria bacterium]
MKSNYENYIGKSKEERKITAEQGGSLEIKRFLLSSNPEIKERLRALQEIFYRAQEKHPEIISLNIFGSLTKGYAARESDIDAYLVIDIDKIINNGRVYEIFDYSDTPVPAINDPNFGETLKKLATIYYRSLIRVPLIVEQGLKPDQLCNIAMRFLRKEDVQMWAETGYVEMLTPLFLLSLGKEIYVYRKIVLDALSDMGKQGEEIWKELMDEVITFENEGFNTALTNKRKKLYPRTLAEGRKYFLP